MIEQLANVLGIDPELLQEYLADPQTLRLAVVAVVLLVAVLVPYRIISKRNADPVRRARREAERALASGDARTAAGLLAQIGADEEALETYVRANAWLDAAQLAMKLGKRERGASLYERAGRFVEAGRILVDIRRYEEAAKLYARVGHHASAAELFERLGRLDEAADHFAQANQLERAGELFAKRKNYARAAELYEKAYREEETLLADKRLEPRKREEIVQLARKTAALLIKAGRGEEGYQMLVDSGDLTTAAQAAIKLGRLEDAAKLLTDLGRTDEAAKLLEQAGKGDQALRLRAERLTASDPGAAAELYEQLREWRHAGELYGTIGQAAEAARCYEEGGDLARAGDWHLKAKDARRAVACYEKGGEYAKAAALYQRLGETNKVIEMLVRAGKFLEAAAHLAQRGDLDQAIKAVDRVAAGGPEGERAAIMKADLVLRKGDRAQALKLYAAALKDAKVGAATLEAYYRYAVLLDGGGQAEQAREALQRIARYDPEFRDVKTRLAAAAGPAPRSAAPVTESEGGRSSGGKKRRYVILEELGRGGMGVVYKAMDRVLDRVVALKVLPSDLSRNEGVVKNFFREAKAAAALNHPNIVTVFDAGQEEDVYYIAMEFIQGLTLKQVLQHKGPFDLPLLVLVTGQVLKGLGFAHSQKIVHRDVKPSNLMWLAREKQVKITDFGLAKVIQEVVNFQTVVGGTPHYMSPEQILGEEVDQRSDLYSLGATVFELATGRVPFLKGDIGYHHIHTQAPDARELRADLPESLALLLMKCMEKEPARRFQNAQEMLEALQQVSRGAG